MSEVKELTDLEKANLLINEDKKQRGDAFQKELAELCVKYNVDLNAVINIIPK